MEKNETVGARILRAIENTKLLSNEKIIPEKYFENTVAQRSPASGCGSVVTEFKGTKVSDVEDIGTLCFNKAKEGWTDYPDCPELMEGCTAFINKELGGELGVIALSDLPVDSDIILDDRKNTGNISATVKGVRGKSVGFVVAILGPENGREILCTFHPGDPCRPSMVKNKPGMHGRHVTVTEAKALGLETAKIVG